MLKFRIEYHMGDHDVVYHTSLETAMELGIAEYYFYLETPGHAEALAKWCSPQFYKQCGGNYSVFPLMVDYMDKYTERRRQMDVWFD